jgi:hypothetical protein
MMKKLYSIIAAMLITASMLGQAPEKMSYQAVVRNASDALLTSTPVGMQISILQGSAIGTAVYVETQTPITNINGLLSLEIGTGTLVSGNFTTIDWTNDIYFIKTEIDPTGNTTYTITGTSQLLSVPYALYAKTSGSSLPGPIGEQGLQGIQGIPGNDGADGANSDLAGVEALGFVTGAHTVDTDTHLDAAGVTALGFTSGAHTIDTDTQLTDAQVATAALNEGFVTGAHTVDTDTHIDAAGVTALGFTSGAHTVDTNTQLSDAQVATAAVNEGFVTGAHTVDTDTHIDAAGVTALGFTSGAHTVNTDTQLTDVQVAAAAVNEGFVTGAHTVDTDTHIDAAGVTALGFTSGTHTVNTDTQLTDAQVATAAVNEGFVTGAHTSYTAGTNINITSGVISSTGSSTAPEYGLNTKSCGVIQNDRTLKQKSLCSLNHYYLL